MTPIEQFHKQIWAALGPVDEAAFEAIAAQPPSDAEVQAVEAVLDAPLPPEFVAFSRKSNGLLVVARTELWPEPELYSVGPAWKFWRGVMLFGFDTGDLPEWASLTTAAAALRDLEVKGVAPVFKVLGDHDRIWGVDRDGGAVLVMDGEVQRLDAPIVELYAAEIAELMDRQQEYVRTAPKR
ncbi:SMI1/KNR4 family protein [Stenotrophomonas sp.]|uniref:SMI1/KNR4 family protein n=1 Tax=Stenotrophomonas sp. TaxID=69392 RepID=UPI0028A75F3A|nr:SMI1/KNR4 family protein [Stenotrophomonas sp.]